MFLLIGDLIVSDHTAAASTEVTELLTVMSSLTTFVDTIAV